MTTPGDWPRRPRPQSPAQHAASALGGRHCIYSCCVTDEDLATAFRTVYPEVEGGVIRDLAAFLDALGREAGSIALARLASRSNAKD